MLTLQQTNAAEFTTRKTLKAISKNLPYPLLRRGIKRRCQKRYRFLERPLTKSLLTLFVFTSVNK